MNEMRDSSERRRFTRVSFDTHAQITQVNNSQVSDVTLLDLCLQGALVELPHKPPSLNTLECGDQIKLELFLDDTETIISMETEIVHIKGRNVGLRCRVLDLDSITHLRRLVELNLGDAELFQRELVMLGH